MRIKRILTVGVTISALVAVLSVGAIPTPTKAGVYACPDMAGPGGLPDGHVDGSDLSAFAAAKAAPSLTADFNDDGAVDQIDQEIFESVFGQSDFSCGAFWEQLHSGTPVCMDIAPAVPDGNIDGSDLSAFAAARESGNTLKGDFNGDSMVNDIDLTMLAMHLGETDYLCPGAAYAQYTESIPPLPPVEQTVPEQPAQVPGESVAVLPVEETAAIPVLSTNLVVEPTTPVNGVVPEVQRAEITTQVAPAPVLPTSNVEATEMVIARKQKKSRVTLEPTVCLSCSRTYVPVPKPIQIPENPTIAMTENESVFAFPVSNEPSNAQVENVQPVRPIATNASAPIDSAKLPFFGLGIPGLILGGLSLRRKLKV